MFYKITIFFIKKQGQNKFVIFKTVKYTASTLLIAYSFVSPSFI